MNHSMYEGQVATYYYHKPGIPIEFAGAQVGGPFKDRDPTTNTYNGGKYTEELEQWAQCSAVPCSAV